MSVNLYDKAIVEDLRKLTEDTRIHIVPSENAFRTIGKLNNTEDYIELPLISISRTGWSLLDAQHSQKFEGATYQYDRKEDYVQNIQLMPIKINYLLDVWTRTKEENDDIMRELIFYYTDHPTMFVTVPYGADYKHKFNIFFTDDVEDNSDIVEQKNRGEYFRQTIGFYTDDAYLWKTSSRPFTKIALSLSVFEKDKKTEVREGDFYYNQNSE